MGPNLYPNESLASQPGVSQPGNVNTPAPFAPQPPPGTPNLMPNPPPSPKGDISAIPANPMSPIPGVSSQSGAMANLYGWDAPAIPDDGGLMKTGPNSWSAGPSKTKDPGFTQPNDDYLNQAIQTYESMDPKQEGGTVGYTGEGHYLDEYNKSVASMTGNTGRTPSSSYSGGGGGGGNVTQQKPMNPYQALQAPELPKFQGQEYAPPEQDQAIYDDERSRAMAPGMRSLREGTREAISSATSLDNPNARGKFIQDALKGYGQGLSQVAGQAHQTATQRSDRKHAEALQAYQTKYDYQNEADLMNFKSEISTIAANFASAEATNLMNYQAGFPQTGQQTTMEKDRAAAFNPTKQNGTPFMGYMQ